MKEDLPNSFRFAGSRGHALTVQRRLIEHYIPEITGVEFDGQLVAPPTPVQWFPDKLAWEMKTPKKVIRKFPPFASFQKFLVSENSVGNITRQEIVSMIPPLLLDIKPGMTVLDLCAAPGSKSAQIIEMVHGGEEARVRKVFEGIAKDEGRSLGPVGMEVDAEKEQAANEDDYSDDGRSTGLLVANDVDYRRAQMLVHQCKRLNSPNLIVVNHDATLFPSIKLPSQSGNSYLKFDRILADVPCSGDGTARKNPEIWKDWSPTKGLGLHTTQVRILVRSLQMLKVGGRVVYSTCSLNPIENEAVIASAIDRCGGPEKVKLVSKDDALPGLQRNGGLRSWKVMDKAGDWWTSHKQMTRTREEKGMEVASKIVEGMFPPDASQHIPLERCMRVYPHMQDTGGFFIAVLEKQTEIKARPENPTRVQETATPGDKPEAGSAMAIVDEINDRPQNGEQDLDKLQAADNFDKAEAAEAEQQTSDIANGSPTTKRPIEDTDPDPSATANDGSNAAKRLKTRNDEPTNDDVATSLDRNVHYPPPPSAQQALDEHQPTSNLASSSTTADAPPKPKQPPNNSSTDESFIYLPPTHPELLEASAFYHLNPRFPMDRFMVRNPAGDPVKAIYYTSALARAILTANEGTGIKFVHCGVKMFVKQDISTLVNPNTTSVDGNGEFISDDKDKPEISKWRIQSEGLPIIESWVGEERVVRVWRKKTLHKLLVEMFPKIDDDSSGSLGELKEQVQTLTPGCAVLRVEPRANEENNDNESFPEEGKEEGFTATTALPLWRGATSINLMLPKEERKAMLLRLYNDDSELVDNSRGAKERNEAKERKEVEKRRNRERGEEFARRRVESGGGGGRDGGREKEPKNRVDPNYATSSTATTTASTAATGGDAARVKAEDEELAAKRWPTLAEIEAAESAESAEDEGDEDEDSVSGNGVGDGSGGQAVKGEEMDEDEDTVDFEGRGAGVANGPQVEAGMQE